MIRFVELYHQVSFPQALTLLRAWCGVTPLLNAAADFYRIQLHRHHEPLAYLDQRGVHSPEVIEHMRIGYAPGRGLRSWLTQLGYPPSALTLCRSDYRGRRRQLYTDASSSPWKTISTAAAFEALRHHIDFCQDRKADCTCGKTYATVAR